MKRIQRVLVVDDSEADVFLATHLLGVSNRVEVVESASDGVDALQRLLTGDARLSPPSLILLDINMPRMDGFHLLERLGEELEGGVPCPVVMVSSSDIPRDMERAKGFTCVKEYLVKPITGQHIAALVDRFGVASPADES